MHRNYLSSVILAACAITAAAFALWTPHDGAMVGATMFAGFSGVAAIDVAIDGRRKTGARR